MFVRLSVSSSALFPFVCLCLSVPTALFSVLFLPRIKRALRESFEATGFIKR